jgi:Ca2+-binding EF-hand superfamily protein
VFSPFAAEDQRALPEIPFHIVNKQRLEKLEAKEAAKRSYSMALKNSSKVTINSDKEKPAVQKPKLKYPRLRLLYFKLITSTNMHMIEFGSLAVSGLTLWSGLVFFLNDQQPRMNRFWTEVFSILVATVNIVIILWLVLKYVLAVVKEAHTRTAISAWADHTMGDVWMLKVKKLTKGQKMWKRRANLAREWKAKKDAKTVSTTESKTESKTRVTPSKLKRQASGWSTINHDKVHSLATAANTLKDYNGSEARKHQRLAVAHLAAQRKLMNRLKSKYGKNAKKGFRLKKYADISSPNVDFDAASKTPLVEVGSRTSVAVAVPIAVDKTVEKMAAKIRVDLGKKMGSEKMLRRVFKRLDVDKSGELEYSEFSKLVQVIEKKNMPEKQVVDYLWDLCRGGDDSVTIHELWMFVRSEDPEMVAEAARLKNDLKSRVATEKLLTKILRRLDTNGSGTIEFHEFSKLLMAVSKVSLSEKLVAYMWDLVKDDSLEGGLTLHQVWIFIHEKQGNFKPHRAKISSENINLLDKAVERSAHI